MLTDYRTVLREELARRTAINSSYSLRAFARALEMAPSALSEILNGKRPLSFKKAQIVVKKLCLSPEEQEVFISSIDGKYRPRAKKVDQLGDLGRDYFLDKDRFSLVADWYHYSIMGMAELYELPEQIEIVAEKLNLPISKVTDGIERLKRVGLLVFTDDGVLKYVDPVTRHNSEIPSEALRKHNREIIYKALESLDNTPRTKRDITSMTISINSKNIGKAKEKIAEFKKEMYTLLKSGADDWLDKLYNLNINLFPLENIGGNKGGKDEN